MMFIHSDVFHPFADAQSSCEFQQKMMADREPDHKITIMHRIN